MLHLAPSLEVILDRVNLDDLDPDFLDRVALDIADATVDHFNSCLPTDETFLEATEWTSGAELEGELVKILSCSGSEAYNLIAKSCANDEEIDFVCGISDLPKDFIAKVAQHACEPVRARLERIFEKAVIHIDLRRAELDLLRNRHCL